MLTVYTSIFDDYDELREPRVFPDGVHYLCYSDRSREDANTWESCVVGDDCVLRRRESPERYAKRIKHTKPLGDSAYVDGNVLVKGDLQEIFHPEVAVAAFRHPLGFNCYAEAVHAASLYPYKAGELFEDCKTARGIMGNGVSPPSYACGVVVRNGTDLAEKFSRTWQDVYDVMKSGRDQLAFAVACHVMGVEPVDLCAVTGGTLLRNRYVSFGSHKEA